jgi:hypothetical protein
VKTELTPYDILTSSNRYEDRIDHEDCTPEVRMRAADLAERVSKLLKRLGRSGDVTSGFRTGPANRAAGGAKNSAHLTGEAADLADPQDAIKDAIAANIANTPPGQKNVLEECDLYMEHPDDVGGWCHLQSRPTRSGRRVFRK